MTASIIRKVFPGAAVQAKLTTNPTNTSTTFDIDVTTGWPTGPTPWVVTINRAQPDEEQVLISSRSGNTLTCLLANRGYAGTAAVAHTAGATVECSIDPVTIDELNRIGALLQTKGEMFVFDGTNVVGIGPPTLDDVLVGDPSLGKGMGWTSRLIRVLSSAPTYKAGDTYFDTTRQQFMVGVAGAWKAAGLSVVVFANTTDRDTLFGANGVAGQPAYVTTDARLYIGTGDSVLKWIPVPKRGEFVESWANAAAFAAVIPTPTIGMVRYLQDVKQHQGYRYTNGGEWVSLSQKVTVGGSLPTDPAPGDVYIVPI